MSPRQQGTEALDGSELVSASANQVGLAAIRYRVEVAMRSDVI